jgi:c(7)-type cytochrome triheme protein
VRFDNETEYRIAGEIHKMIMPRYRIRTIVALIATICIIAIAGIGNNAEAEYGDVVMNEYSDDAGMRPVVFPHWFHRVRFRCKVCHGDLGFEFKAGGNEVNMVKIIDGEYCGACHNGDVAWSIENCELCHSGVTGTQTQVHHSTVQKLLATPKDDSTPESQDDNGDEQ